MASNVEKEALEREKVRLRVQKHRNKFKLDQEAYTNYLKKDAERKKQERAKQKNELMAGRSTKRGKIAVELKRLKETERKRKYRQKKKEQRSNNKEVNNVLGSFSSVQSLGKAFSRVKKVLPKSPSKKLAVVKKLVYATTQLPESQRKALFNEVSKVKITAVSKETEEKVHAFFCRDDISRMAPGKRDCKTVKNKYSGNKEKVQKRHMVMTVKEAYSLFTEENPAISLKKSKFYELRPKHVLLSSEMPHNVCVCKLHANFNFITETLSKTLTDFPTTGKELLIQICCDIKNEECMTEGCEKCQNKTVESLCLNECDLTKEVSWKQWGEVNKRPMLTTVNGTVEEAITMLQNMLLKFKTHCFVKNVQSQYFEEKKNRLSKGEAVLQVDFAENYTCVAQDEIQSAHWSNTLVTIFTCVAWVPDGKQCYAIVSNDLTHNKFSVWCFLKKIISNLKSEHGVEEVTIFSDGCAGQFKSRYTLSNLTFIYEDYGVTGEWAFFATSHGKGAVDGVGGTVKRLVWEKVITRQVNVSSAEEFFNCCKNVCSCDINIMFIDSQEIKESMEMLESRWASVQPIPEIQSKHYFRASSCNARSIVSGRTVNSELSLSQLWKDDEEESQNQSDSELDELEDTSPQSSTAQHKRVRYSEVYSDSENEDQYLLAKPVPKSEVKANQFILIELQGKKGRKQKYVGITQSGVDEDDNVEVIYMNTVCGKKSEQLFKIEHSKPYIVPFAEVCGVLKSPEIKDTGNRTFYKFEKPIEL